MAEELVLNSVKSSGKSSMKRVNIRVTDEVYNYFKDKSENSAVSMSALMYLALEEYVHNKKALTQMPDLLSQISEFEKLFAKK